MYTFDVKGMSCGHCVRAITEALHALDAQADVQVDLQGGAVRVTSQLTAEEILNAIRAEGYSAQPR